MAIMMILVGSVLVASSVLIEKSRVSNTRAVLTLVRDAVEQFAREQEAHPTITGAKQGLVGNRVTYLKRYGYFPPDELEMFSPSGLPGCGAAGQTLAVGGAEIVPAPDYPVMKFYTSEREHDEAALEHRDLAAMIVAIELYGDASSEILDRIPARNRTSGPLDLGADPPVPVQFLDRDGNGNWDPGDLQIRYIVDDWGIPISYLAQRDWDPADPGATASTNRDGWNELSTRLIRLNGGQPVIFSYGPNGAEQLTVAAMGNDDGLASLVGDFDTATPDLNTVDHVLNADNVYANDALKAKLAKGL